MEIQVEHNLKPEELSKALVGLAQSHHIEAEVANALCKALEESTVIPRQPAMRGLFFRFRALYREAIAWCSDYADTAAQGRLEKAENYIDRPLTKEEIQKIQQAIRDRFGYLAAQFGSEDVVVTEEVLDRWKQLGLVDGRVTPKSFSVALPGETKLVRNAFVFGRLQQAVEKGKTYQEVLKLALNLPLLKPDHYAIAVAEQQTATHITGLAEDLATLAGKLAADKNRAIIRNMAVDFHAQKLKPKILDEEVKRELGLETTEATVDTWQGFSSELYHAMEDKSKDWDRIAFYELEDARRQGQGLGLLAKYGPDKLVYKLPLPTACPQCKFLYLNEDGTPRLFRIGEMMSQGNNIGRKPYPVRGGVVSGSRDDGAEELKAVAGLVHPWCQCQLFPLSGLEPWLKNHPQLSSGEFEIK